MEVHHELLGADITEHRVRHGKVCIGNVPLRTIRSYKHERSISL